MLTHTARASRRVPNAPVAAWLVVSQFMAAGVSFLVNLIAAYGLDPTQRGLLAFVLQIGYFLTIVALFGTERPFIRQIRDRFDISAALLVRILAPGYLMPVLIAAGAVVAWVFGDGTIAVTAAWLVLLVAGNMHLRITRAAFIASGAWRTFINTTVVSQALTLGFAVILALLGVNEFSVWLAGYAVALLVPTLVVARHALAARATENGGRMTCGQVRREGLTLLPASLGNTAMFRSDRLLLPVLAGPAQLGLYIVVAAALEVAVWPIQQWADSKLNAWKEAGTGSRRKVAIPLILKSAGVVALLAMFLGSLVLVILLFVLPEEYEDSVALIAPLVIANVIYGATRTQQGLAIAAGHARLVSVAEVAGMVVSLMAYLILIPYWGGMGAALGSVIGYAVCLLVGAWSFRTRTDRERTEVV